MAAKPLRRIDENPPERTPFPQKAVGLDQLIHERVRLGIVSALAGNASMTFGELKQVLGLTDGNLSIHARKLEDAGYVDCRKFFEGRKPQTEYSLTLTGRAAFEKYVNHMEALIQAMKPSPSRTKEK
jgi:DNA-binding transcriptional ArsR family regulator